MSIDCNTDQVFDQAEPERIAGMFSVPRWFARVTDLAATEFRVTTTPIGGTLFRKHYIVNAEQWNLILFFAALKYLGVNVKAL